MGKLEERESKRKKSVIASFVSEPEETIITTPEVQVTDLVEIEPNIKENPIANVSFCIESKSEELRSQKANFLVQPSVYKEVKKKCKKMGVSVNEIVNQFFVNFIE